MEIRRREIRKSENRSIPFAGVIIIKLRAASEHILHPVYDIDMENKIRYEEDSRPKAAREHHTGDDLHLVRGQIECEKHSYRNGKQDRCEESDTGEA